MLAVPIHPIDFYLSKFFEKTEDIECEVISSELNVLSPEDEIELQKLLTD